MTMLGKAYNWGGSWMLPRYDMPETCVVPEAPARRCQGMRAGRTCGVRLRAGNRGSFCAACQEHPQPLGDFHGGEKPKPKVMEDGTKLCVLCELRPVAPKRRVCDPCRKAGIRA